MIKTDKNSWGSIKESFNRVRILTLMQLKTIKKKKELSKGRKILSLIVNSLLFVAIIAAITLVLRFVITIFQTSFLTDYRTLIFYLMIIQVISLITCSMGLMNSLFLSQDNLLLLAFPCKHSEVFLSKLLVYYVSEFKKNLYMSGTVMIAFGLNQSNGILSPINFIPALWYSFTFISLFILPLIPVLLGSIISLPLSQFKRLSHKNSIFEVISMVLLVSIIYAVIFTIVSKLPPKIAVITKYTSFIDGAKKLIFGVSNYGFYAKWMVNIMSDIKPLLNVLWIILTIIFSLVLTILVIMPFFFKVVSHSMEQASVFKHKSRSFKGKSIIITFLKKELKISFRNIGFILTNHFLLIIMPAIIILIAGIYTRMKIDPLTSKSYISFFTMFFILILSLMNNDDASTALTREGSEFVLLKTAPNKTNQVVWGKAITSYLVYIVLSSISFLMLFIGLKATNSMYLLDNVKIIGNFKINNILFLYILSLILNLALIFKSITYDLRDPHLQEYSSTRSIKDNPNIQRSAGTSLIIVFFVTLIYIITSLISPLKAFSYLLLIALAIIYLVTSYISIRKYIYAFFDDIEV